MDDLFILAVAVVVLSVTSIFLMLKLRFFQKEIARRKQIESYSQEFVASLSDDYRFLRVASSSINTIEMAPSLLQGRFLKDFVHPDDLDLLFRSLEAPSGDDRLKMVLFRCRHGSEGWCWVEMYGKKISIKSKKKLLVCHFKNVDSFIKLRSNLVAIEKRLHIFLTLSSDIVWQFDVEKRELEVLTPIAFERHRIPSKIPGKTSMEELMPFQDMQLVENVINARVQHFSEYGRDVSNPEEIFIRLYGVDESHVWYSVKGLLDNDLDGRLMFFGTGHIVERALVNKIAPDAKENLFDQMLSLPYVRIFWTDKEEICLGCNQAFASDFGLYNTNKVIGKSMNSLYSSNPLHSILKEKIEEIFETGKGCSGKAEFFIGSGSVPHILFYSIMPLKDEKKDVYAIMGVYLVTNIERLAPLDLTM